MSGGDPVFVDTNVLVYSRDASEPDKQPVAIAWLDALWRSHRGCLSTQVLNEYYVTVTGTLKPGLPIADAREDVRSLMVWDPLPLDVSLLDGAFRIQDEFGFSYWDALIVSAAQRSGAAILLSEDLQDGQELHGTLVVDPFRHAPERFLKN